MLVPRSDLSVTTTSWSVVLASRSASLVVSSAIVAWSRMPASSTTRPVSAGKSSAAAAGATSASQVANHAANHAAAHSAARDHARPGARIDALELHLRIALGFLADGEFLHRLAALVERRGPDHARKRAQLGVVGTHRLDVVAARHRDAVLGALELRLQRQEVLVRFEIGIPLRHGDQAAERAGQLRLRLLEALERFGIADGLGRHLDRRRLGARRRDVLEHGALLGGKAL